MRACAATIAVVLAVPLSAFASEPPAFRDVTESSGVAAVVKSHYANVPKWWLSGMHLIDLDGDGHLDLYLTGHGAPVAAARNDGKGHFTYVDPKLSVPRGVRHDADLPYPGGEVRMAYDFDEDGKIDLLAAWHDDGGALYRNDCRSGDTAQWNFKRSHALEHFCRATAMIDLDGDGFVDYLGDAAAGRNSAPKLVAWFGKGGGVFDRQRTFDGMLRESCPIPVDIDGDGRVDWLVSQRGYNPPGRRIFHNEGGLRFTNVTRQCGLSEDGGSIHGVGDLNQDGHPDLICIEGNQIVIYLNDGHGHFAKGEPIAGLYSAPASARPQNTNWGGAVVVDVDNDGLPDILINGRYFLAVLRGVGPGKFAWMNQAWGLPTGAWSAVDEGLCFGDIDGDGRLDLVTCGAAAGDEKTVRVFHNELPKRNWLRVRPIGKPGNCAAAGAKIRLYEPGTTKLLSYEQVAIWGRQSFHSYYSQVPTERHFGLGNREAVDVSVEFYPSGRRVEQKGVKANTVVEVTEP